ncbi:MAG: ATP-binding protein [Clostridiales bacterium]|nr:ATP-binding protein [Clostridiales bacterium]
MKELSLHILDIIENSISAEATIIKLRIYEDIKDNLLTIEIDDNGKGMSKEMLYKVLDPFVTSRTTRRVGLGLSLTKQAANQCDGDLVIDSKENEGTNVTITFQYDHIDRAPIGDMADTVVSMILTNDNIDYEYLHKVNDKEFIFSTEEIKKLLAGVSITEVDIIAWVKEYVEEGIENLHKN